MARQDRHVFVFVWLFVAILYGWLLFMEISPLIAQQTPLLPTECTEETVTALASAMQAQVGEALPLIEGGDLVGALDALYATQAQVAALRALCDGLAFEGAGDTVLGPLALPDGFYRMTYSASGFGTASIETVEGDCDLAVMAMVADMGGGESEQALNVTGCTALVQVSGPGEWKLQFERLTTG